MTGGEALWASDGPEEDPQQTSMPEPSPQRNNEWIHWHTQHVEIPAWWQELQEVPSQSDIKEFIQRMHASFQVPKVRCHISKVENNYSVPPATPVPRQASVSATPGHEIWQDHLQVMMQLQKTLVYGKVLQHWAEKAQPLTTGKPC